MPRSIQYSIISNPRLQIKTEDSFLDLICEIVNNKTFSEDIEKVDDILFLEQVEFTGLSENKLRQFLNNFDFSQTTNSLWRKFYQCFFIHFDENPERTENRRTHKENFEYIENETLPFDGIINHLTKQNKGNLNSNEIINITSSSVLNDNHPQNVAKFDNNRLVFSTINEKNAWIKLDFISRKVCPSYYSIKTWNSNKNEHHLKNWVIEGSNNDKNWKVLDSRNNNISLNNNHAENTFKIQSSIIEYYRYLRLRQTGHNCKNKDFLIINNLEFFGIVI